MRTGIIARQETGTVTIAEYLPGQMSLLLSTTCGQVSAGILPFFTAEEWRLCRPESAHHKLNMSGFQTKPFRWRDAMKNSES